MTSCHDPDSGFAFRFVSAEKRPAPRARPLAYPVLNPLHPQGFVMQPLSQYAAAVLDRMEPNRPYDALELRSFLPNASMDTLREIMQELWVNRQVERFGYTGWRKQASTCGSDLPVDPRSCAHCRIARNCPHCVSQAVEHVTPEQLFDHAAFDGIFK